MTVYVTILVLFVIGTMINVLVMPTFKKRETRISRVSILVPMRNESRNAAGLVASLQSLDWPDFDVCILDDHSEDDTREQLHRAIGTDGRFRVLSGRPLPDGWVGKVHACHQLSEHATGEVLLFVDADVRLKPAALSQALHVMNKYDAGLVTGFAQFPCRPLLAKLLVPMQTFFVFFHLPVALANKTRWPAATAAHGGFMLFQKKAYDAIGGHESVQSSLIEDVHIARNMKKAGFRAVIANIAPSVSCHMYETNRETWEGFLKNSFNGINRSKTGAVSLIGFYALFYIGPFLLLWVGEWLPFLLILIQKGIADKAARQPLFYAFLISASAAAFIALLWTASRKKAYGWKGRTYHTT